MITRIAFYLPTIVLTWLSLLFPFSRATYKPSSENEREMSQYMRNKVRFVDYKAKQALFRITKQQ